MEDFQSVALACVVVVITVYAVQWYADPLRAIPTLGGPSLPGLSYLGALRTLDPGGLREILEEGYRKYPESAFKIPMFDRWIVVVSGRSMVEELRKRPDEELSGSHGFHEVFQSKYFFEPAVLSDRYHAVIIKEKLTKGLPSVLPDVIDEVSVAVQDNIAAARLGVENEWTSVEVLPTMSKIVARASSRAFVGLPLCRNEEYLALAVGFSMHFKNDGRALRLVPDFMKCIVAPFIRTARDDIVRVVPHVRPIIEERMKVFTEFGEGWNDKPNDLLQSILDRAMPRGETVSVIVQRLFILHFASIVTSSSIITHVINHLAENPDHLIPLREEIKANIVADGWTSTGMGHMWKLDSILRETLRYHGVSPLSMYRKAMKDITLHDGTRIPKGTVVSTNVHPQHHDAAILENAGMFDAFRYARMRSVEGQSLKHQFTSTSPEYIAFGYGPRACPGRYFASNELKAILAYIILNYDLKAAGGGSRTYTSMAVVPAQHGRVLFRRHEDSSV